MRVFLTSSPTGSLDGLRKIYGLDHANGFVLRLKENWKENSRVLVISASPSNHEGSLEMTNYFKRMFEIEKFSISSFDLWDDHTTDFSLQVLLSYDVILLGGGHVPTQNSFFSRIQLRDKIKHFNGTIIGISAGSMNCADYVYAQPEEAGESIDPNYSKWLRGLDLTKIMMLPHYNTTKSYMLDGKRLYEDITYSDSYGNNFVVLEDGSYILCEDGKEIVYGSSYIIHDGIMNRLCNENEEYVMM